ncbi:hypothetical protein [Roseospira goensis]|uniref:Uncharacterized protein n=1 Tax=Roseospira goensis TaxID=391922 RepID=A0A7W6S1G1_9PROT|nr:hypothetical protein [Roseospira goensis]MBB4286976.1 hypothetical protein [Roseospira goensis]
MDRGDGRAGGGAGAAEQGEESEADAERQGRGSTAQAAVGALFAALLYAVTDAYTAAIQAGDTEAVRRIARFRAALMALEAALLRDSARRGPPGGAASRALH